MIFMFIGILCSLSLGCCEAHLGNICRVDIIVKWFLFVVIQNNAYYDEIITHKCYRVLVTLPCFSSPGPCYHPNSFPYSLFHFCVPLTILKNLHWILFGNYTVSLILIFCSSLLMFLLVLVFFNGQNLYKYKIIIEK